LEVELTGGTLVGVVLTLFFLLFLLVCIQQLLHDRVCTFRVHTTAAIFHDLANKEPKQLRLAIQEGIEVLLGFL
jgi:hypothetical protein